MKNVNSLVGPHATIMFRFNTKTPESRLAKARETDGASGSRLRKRQRSGTRGRRDPRGGPLGWQHAAVGVRVRQGRGP